MEETVPKVRGAANVEIVGLMVSLNRMEVGQGGVKSALDEIHEKYGFEGKARYHEEVDTYIIGNVGIAFYASIKQPFYYLHPYCS